MNFLSKLTTWSLALLAIGLMVSCKSSSVVSLDYQPSLAQRLPGKKNLSTGHFADFRGQGQNQLGTVRSPIGTSMERIDTRIPITEVVGNSFAHGLSARGMLATGNSAVYMLTGEIVEFKCDQLLWPVAKATVRVNITRIGTGQIIYSRLYRSQREGKTYIPGTGSPVPAIRELASRALQEVVDRALDDPALRSRLARY